MDKQEIVKITGGKWEGREALVGEWIPGLHYQMVYADGDELQVINDWIERTEKKSAGLSQDFFEAIIHMAHNASNEYIEDNDKNAVDYLKVIIADAKQCITELEGGN